jgi:NAD(P)-dependent dehydrogenase (short-subunit alcohol dehydrogenase family)
MSLVILTGVGRAGQVGEVLARRFAVDGHRVVLLDRDADAVAERAAELRADGYAVDAHAVDLTDPAALATIAARVAEDSPDGVAALVAAAGGFAATGPVADTAPDVLARMVAINLTTAFLATHAFLPLLRPARGAIVYLTSPAALPGATGAGMAAYAAAKAGVLALMRAVAAEEAPHGVRANALAPAAVRTAANLAAMGADARYVERETVAEVVAWLCAERGVTGQVIELTGE